MNSALVRVPQPTPTQPQRNDYHKSHMEGRDREKREWMAEKKGKWQDSESYTTVKFCEPLYSPRIPTQGQWHNSTCTQACKGKSEQIAGLFSSLRKPESAQTGWLIMQTFVRQAVSLAAVFSRTFLVGGFAGSLVFCFSSSLLTTAL